MSVGKDNCIIGLTADRKHTHVSCKHCDWENTYKDPVVAQRMASNHIVKKHRDIAKPASETEKPSKRKYTFIKRKPRGAAVPFEPPQAGEPNVNFCPCCGFGLQAVRVAMSI